MTPTALPATEKGSDIVHLVVYRALGGKKMEKRVQKAGALKLNLEEAVLGAEMHALA